MVLIFQRLRLDIADLLPSDQADCSSDSGTQPFETAHPSDSPLALGETYLEIAGPGPSNPTVTDRLLGSRTQPLASAIAAERNRAPYA